MQVFGFFSSRLNLYDMTDKEVVSDIKVDGLFHYVRQAQLAGGS
jgi:hypothetical protein